MSNQNRVIEIKTEDCRMTIEQDQADRYISLATFYQNGKKETKTGRIDLNEIFARGLYHELGKLFGEGKPTKSITQIVDECRHNYNFEGASFADVIEYAYNEGNSNQH